MKDFILGKEAKKQLAERGVDEKIVRFQANVLNGPPPFVHLDRPCAVGDGIALMSDEDMRFYSDLYGRQTGLAATAFVPASGAASRMFSRLVSGDEKCLESFTENIKRFAFFDDLRAVSANFKRGDIESLSLSRQYADIAHLVLSPEGLGYENIPKGLVKFHRYGNVSKTAFEEHIELACLYARGADGICRIHFTVPQSFSLEIKRHLGEAVRRVGNADVSFSFQNPETDTVAVDGGGNLLTDESGQIVFRPAGHGALLNNLNSIGDDFVFISNIDNVSHRDRAPEDPALGKKALAGLRLETREKIRFFMRKLENGTPGESAFSEALGLCSRFGFSPPRDGKKSPEDLLSFFRNALDRPLRVCGVLKNAEESGGGRPFWAKDIFGRVSPQIVESIQINRDCAGQRDRWSSSAYFNPVEIVCSMKNCAGEKFNLRDYCDDVFMVAEKTFGGRPVRALEMPGLWNGAMSGWNTLFAEIPSGGFSPVKDVFDLLRASHQDVESDG